MLKYTKIDNGINFTLHSTSNNYDEEYNNHFLKKLENENYNLDNITNISENPLVCLVDKSINKKIDISQLSKTFMCRKIISTIKNNINNDNNTLNYTSFLPENFIQDLIILTNLKDKFPKICVNFVTNLNGYIKILQSTNNCDDLIGIQNDKIIWIDNDKLSDYDKKLILCVTTKIIKFLEWFKSIGIDMELTIFENFNDLSFAQTNNNVPLCDILVGIGYENSYLEVVDMFIEESLRLVKNGGFTFSLALYDSLCNLLYKEYFIKIFQNNLDNENIDNIRSQKLKIKSIEDKLGEEEIDIRDYDYKNYDVFIDGEYMKNEDVNKIRKLEDIKKIQIKYNNKVYKYYCSNIGIKFRTQDYKKIKSKLTEEKEKYNSLVAKLKAKNMDIIDWQGSENKISFKIMENLFKNKCNETYDYFVERPILSGGIMSSLSLLAYYYMKRY